jgi:hypothetical protein
MLDHVVSHHVHVSGTKGSLTLPLRCRTSSALSTNSLSLEDNFRKVELLGSQCLCNILCLTSRPVPVPLIQADFFVTVSICQQI